MPLILDGKKAQNSKKEVLKKHVASMKLFPTLAIIQIGSDSRSNAYILQKKKFAEKIGARVIVKGLNLDVREEELFETIKSYNTDPSISGIILQLPIPHRLPKEALINAIDQKKDVDGLTDANNELFRRGDIHALVPATARGVLSLLAHYEIPIRGKKVAVLGRSRLVGAPTAELMRREGGIVTVCHSKTENVPGITRESDIVVVAIGKPRFVTKEFLKPGHVVVDVGINVIKEEGVTKLEEEIPKEKLVGDVDFEGVKDMVAAISPVPGGVGPMTVCSLFENLIDTCAELQRKGE